MADLNTIRYLRHDEIDKQQWDECISQSSNGLIYGYSFYLDTMAEHWDALVLGDYAAVMPLTWNKKYGIKYLYQPFLAAQLGIFARPGVHQPVHYFMAAIPGAFRFIDISLNTGNLGDPQHKYSRERSNYVLDLQKPYEELYNNYRDNIRRNTRKAIQLGCVTEKDFDAERVILLAIEQMKSQGSVPVENVDRFRKLYRQLREKDMATTYGISLNGVLLASCIFFFSHQRAYYILVGNHSDSKNTGASHALIDAFIKDHAGQELILDFEGSDIPSLAFYYSSFGAVCETYPAIRVNRLPWVLRWMKRV